MSWISAIMSFMKILTTGTLSGLGKHIYNDLGGIFWTRNITDKAKKKLTDEGVDVIIHCAFNSSQSVDSNNLYDYLSDNVLLTKELLNIPHKKLIFISSVDVYPKDKKRHKENETIDINQVSSLYGITKLMSETLIKNKCRNFLILRCTSLLGRNSRKNSLIKIIKDSNPILTITDDSVFNYVLHSDISDFIKLAIKQDVQGVYNVASSWNITLSEVAEMLGKKVNLGKFYYNVGNIDNSKISSIFPAFKKTSKEAILEFIGSKYL